MTLVLDANESRLGRMAAYAAKAALEGQSVVVINCEQAVITGSRTAIMGKYVHRREQGRPTKGPFLPRMSDRFVRRVIRGMLPYRTPRGLAAFKRVQCYIGTPKEFEGQGQRIATEPAERRMKIGELCTLLGGKS